MMVTRCPECGQENDEGATVCVTCDSSLNTEDYDDEDDMDDDLMDDDWDEDENEDEDEDEDDDLLMVEDDIE
jgi:hypothetical protein